MPNREAERKRRRREATRRCRARQKRGRAVYLIEIDETTFDLLERFENFDIGKADDREAVSDALGRLLRRGLTALLHEATHL
jgi:hypothetical protein